MAITIEATPLFAGLNAAALRTLRGRAVERRYAAGETLFVAGAPARGLFVILDGAVRVVRSRNGRQHVVHLESAGGTLGEVPLYSGGGYPATAIAAEDTRCVVIARDVLATMMVDDPELSWRLLARLSVRVRGLVERVDNLATRDVASRLAAYVLAHTLPEGNRNVATLRGTQAQLAEELGTVREVVVRHIRALLRAGVLTALERGRYEVVRIDALRDAAGVQS